MYLQNLGLGEEKVSHAIKLVVEGFMSSPISGKLPSASTHQRVGSEIQALALKTTKESLARKKNYDSTTGRAGRHITEVELAASGSQPFFVGLRAQS